VPKPISADQNLDPVTRASLDELRALQVERLRWTLSHAYANVAHYKTAIDAAGVHPDDIKDLTDLAKLPFTTKETLRDNFPFGLFAVPRERVLRVHASSGTTGKPTVVGYTERDLDTWAVVAARSMRAAGARPGDIVHIAVNYGMFTGGFGWHDGATRLGCTVIPASGGQTERQVQFIEDFRPSVIAATPTYMLTILDEMERQGVDPRESSLNVGVFGAEPWTDKMRHSMEERADFHAVDTYGLSELIGPGVAAESFETKDGPHVWEDHFYPEVIDPDTGEVLPDGEHGELVLTSLTKEAMPVIRYRTRDLTRLLPGTAFGAMRRIEKVAGRSDDMMIVRAVNVFPTQIEEIILREPELTPHFQCHLDRQGNMDSLLVKVERRDSVSPAEGAAAGRRVADRVKHLIGIRITVDVSAPHTVERSAGKMRRVVDHRENL
jgi:phenylacetate-CoA ligase